MATSYEIIKQYLKEEGYNFISNEGYIETSISSENYRNDDSEKLLSIVIKLEEDGKTIKVIAPYVYNFKFKAGSNLKASLFQSLLEVSWKTKFVQFEYDPNDGEIRGIVEFPLEDAELTKKQFVRAITTLSSVIDLYHEEIIKSLTIDGEYTFGDPHHENDARYSGILNQTSSSKFKIS
jgi:hypothetical protein